MVGERLVGVPQAGPRTPTPTAKLRLGVLTLRRLTLTMVERPQRGILHRGRLIPMVMEVGHLGGTRAHEHRIPMPREDALQVGMRAHGRPTRIPAQVRTRMLLVQAQVGVSLRVALLRAGNNRREVLITIAGVILQLRMSG